MGPKDKPLLTRQDLLEAIKLHFMNEMTVDYNEQISKFLSFKREEVRCDYTLAPGRRVRHGRDRHTGNAIKPGLGANAVDSSSCASGTVNQQILGDAASNKTRNGGTMAKTSTR